MHIHLDNEQQVKEMMVALRNLSRDRTMTESEFCDAVKNEPVPSWENKYVSPCSDMLLFAIKKPDTN